MGKSRLHTIVQILSIVVLFCGYFVSDPPDCLSEMHFNSNPETPSVISKASKPVAKSHAVQKITSGQNEHPGKTKTVKYVSLEFAIPVFGHGYHFIEVPDVVYSCPLPEEYSFLFFREINPPPPKGC